MIETFAELKEKTLKLGLIEAILTTQTEDSDFSCDEILCNVEKIADSMIQTIKTGLSSNKPSRSGLSGLNTSILSNAPESSIVSDFNKKVMTYALATIEENSRMGKISACPTAGSSGIVPAVLVAAMEDFKKDKKDLINSLIVAGEFGRIISLKMPLAGAVAGCQAECGTASGMASAALTFMLSGDIEQILNACALNLKNVLGLTCDPVAGLVEVPCVKRNAFLSSHAINACYLALAGMRSSIPLDDVIDSMVETGNLMSPKLKESSEAGLATTKTGFLIKDKLSCIFKDDIYLIS